MERPNKELFTAAWLKFVTTGQVAEALGMSCEDYMQKLNTELPQEEKEIILAVIKRLERKPADKALGPFDSVGILTKGYAQIIAFRDEKAFLEILEANPHLEPLYGTKNDEKQGFPGLYLVGYIKG